MSWLLEPVTLHCTVSPTYVKKYKSFHTTFCAFLWVLGTSVLRLRIHARLPGVLGEARQCDQEEGNATDEKQDEGGTGAGEGPGVTVLDPERLLAVDHPLHGLSHDFYRDDDAET